MGFNADIDIAGGGAGSSLSVNGGKTNLNANYKAVGEQSGIFTGDGGLDLTAKSKTTLIGGAITTTEAARDAGRNNYESLGGITTQDIENTTSYDGDAIQVGVSVGNTDNKPQASMNGLGYGTDSDSDSSVTRAGITGIAGNSGITTDNRAEYAGILENGFDAGQVNKELDAQTQITQEFGKEAPKAIAEFSQNRIDALRANPNLSADEKMDAISKWDEGGIYRVAAHTALGALGTGSVEGALTTGGVAAAAPSINNLEAKMRDALIAQGMDADTASNTTKGITSLALAGAGVAAGLDTSSTVTAVNVDANNRQLHWSEMQKLNESAKGLASKYGRDIEYWKSLLYAVTYSELDKKGNADLEAFKKDFAKPAYTQNAQAFEKIIENDIARAKQSYNSLKAKYGNVELEKDRNTSVRQSKPIHMFDDSGYYNENSIYGTYGGSYQGNRNNQKDFDKVTRNLNNQMSDIATRDDRIEPLYPEQYYIPLSELKAVGTAGVAGVKKIAATSVEKRAAQEAAQAGATKNLDFSRVCSGTVCFTAGTLIHTIHGLKTIETIEYGELIWSREEFGDKYDYKPVVATKVTPNIPIYEVKVQHDNGLEETFNTTEEHPFWIDGEGWRKASILKSGMKLLDKHSNVVATIISQTALERNETVYNFEVQDFHTYHIGEIGLWVHNANCCDFTDNWGAIEPKFKAAGWVDPKTNKVRYLDPFDGKLKNFSEDVTPSVDHILPRAEAKDLAGGKLTAAELNNIVNAPENLMPLPKHLNSSKGRKVEYSNGGWVEYGNKGKPIPINSTYKKTIERIQVKIRKDIADAIKLKEGK